MKTLSTTKKFNIYFSINEKIKSTIFEISWLKLFTESGGGFSNDLRETLTYGELFKHEFDEIMNMYATCSII